MAGMIRMSLESVRVHAWVIRHHDGPIVVDTGGGPSSSATAKISRLVGQALRAVA